MDRTLGLMGKLIMAKQTMPHAGHEQHLCYLNNIGFQLSDPKEYKSLVKDGKDWIARLQKKEMHRTGINSLKVGYNKVFGYYIEITKPNLSLVPPDYIRKQTLVNAERFITPELKEHESAILGAEERMANLEKELFLDLRDRVCAESKRIQLDAELVAEIDALQSLAHVAAANDYCRPELNASFALDIEEGRHPVLEQLNLEIGRASCRERV